jgi:putative transposase
MGNHFHLLLETPEPNLVSGMKWLLGGFSQAWNRRYKRTGHVFQGRYKSIPVAGERASDAYHFRIVADYIHLNPARAKLAGGTNGALSAYRWSSLPAYVKGKGPEWLVFDRVLDAFSLAHSGRGRRAYSEWLEIREAQDGGMLPDTAMQALRKGWYLGEDTFRDKLLALLEKGAKAIKGKGSHSGMALQTHDESAAETIVKKGLCVWKMPDGEELQESIRKGDSRKVAIAILIKRHTSVSNIWIAERLGMGHDRSVSRLIKQGKTDETTQKQCRELEKMLQCED